MIGRVRVDVGVLEDGPDGGCGDGDAEHGEFAVDTSVSPLGFSRARRVIKRCVSMVVEGRPGRCW